jgi:hypothetical protein
MHVGLLNGHYLKCFHRGGLYSASGTCIQEVPGLSIGTAVIQSCFVVNSKCLQGSSGKVPRSYHSRFLPNPFLFIILNSVCHRCRIARVTDCKAKAPIEHCGTSSRHCTHLSGHASSFCRHHLTKPNQSKNRTETKEKHNRNKTEQKENSIGREQTKETGTKEKQNRNGTNKTETKQEQSQKQNRNKTE